MPTPFRRLLIMLLLAAAGSATAEDSKPVVTGVVLHRDSIHRTDARGDNWCLTWAADDSQITSMDDGNWLGEKTSYHNRLYRIVGGSEDFEREEIENYPRFVWGKGSWFGYGIVAVGDDLYSVISKTPKNSWSGPFRGIKILKSSDGGETWMRIDRNGGERPIGRDDDARNEVSPEEMFFLEEFGLTRDRQPAYPFSFVDFAQHGKANAEAPDDFIYIYSPEGARTHELLLARVPKDRLGVRAEWEYFVILEDGKPVWSSDIEDRGPIHRFPEASSQGDVFGWYSWLPSVVWNAPLGCYVMVNGGTYGGGGMTAADKDYFDSWMHERTGSLGFWVSDTPWGPWREIFYEEYWTADDPANLTYQPKLSPKWIGEDGREMIFIWSDAMKNDQGRSHTVRYTWNQMRIELETESP